MSNMNLETDPMRNLTSMIAMGTVVALAGCGELTGTARKATPDAGASPKPGGAQPAGAFGAALADGGPATAAGYRSVFERHGLALDAVRFGAPVPRLFADRLPADMNAVRDIDARQSVFVATLLPIVLDVNARIRLERARIHAIAEAVANGETAHAFDRNWIDRIALRYGAEDMRELLRRVDEIPPSLAIAQAAIETGWGTSRFAQDGNALYGQRLTDGEGGLRPAGFDADPGFRVAAFADLMASVESYALNLNTHPAYAKFRLRRARARDADAAAPLDGYALAETMHRYSERGWNYVVLARSVIRDNRLEALDGARLRPPAAARASASAQPEMAAAAP
jgi:Bax protein